MNEEQDAPRFRAHAPRSVGETKPLKSAKFLIANLELEFHVSPIRITKLKFSNRKFFAIFSSKRVTDDASRAAFSSSSKPQASSFQKPSPPWRLIYGTAIRNSANSRGLNNVQFSNRIIYLTPVHYFASLSLCLNALLLEHAS
jgi:hypothetical protein